MKEMKSTPLHIVFAIHSLRAGGAERVVSILVNQLSQNPRYKISIITFTGVQESPFYPTDKRVNLIGLGDIENKKKSLLKKAYNIVNGSWKFWKALRAQKPDVLISFIDTVNFLSLLLTRGSKLPVIVSERYDPTTFKRNWVTKVLRRLTYPFAMGIVAQSSLVARFLGKRLASKVKIIGNPVSQPKKHADQKVKSTAVKIISVGRLIPSKRMDFLIAAFRQVQARYPKAQLVICGDGPERESLERLIKELGLEKNVKLLGTVKDVEGELTKAQIFAFASESEGFPNALCEAMAVGLVPVITDYGSSTRDIIQEGKNGFVVGRDDKDALVHKICRLIEDEKLRHKIAKEAEKISQTYGVGYVIKQWEEVIHRAVNK